MTQATSPSTNLDSSRNRAVLRVGSQHRQCRTLVFHYGSPFLNGTAGNTAVSSVFDGGSGIPDEHTVCFSYGLGGNALSQPTPWSVSDFTGMAVPTPATQYQAGVDASWYGSSACQIAGNAMGFQVHKFSAPAAQHLLRPAVGVPVG